MELAGIQEDVTKAIVVTEGEHDLGRNLMGREWAEYLPHVRAYILHDIDSTRMGERMNSLKRVRGVVWAIPDSQGKPSTFMTSEVSNDPGTFWPLDSHHSDAFSPLGACSAAFVRDYVRVPQTLSPVR